MCKHTPLALYAFTPQTRQRRSSCIGAAAEPFPCFGAAAVSSGTSIVGIAAVALPGGAAAAAAAGFLLPPLHGGWISAATSGGGGVFGGPIAGGKPTGATGVAPIGMVIGPIPIGMVGAVGIGTTGTAGVTAGMV